MGVIYIGDRAVGKTHLAMELANARSNHVSAQVANFDYDRLRALLGYDELTEEIKEPTLELTDRYLDVEVKLPTGTKKVQVDWIDTPGEIWRQSWQKNNPKGWQEFLKLITNSEGILLVLPPYRELVLPEQADPEDFMTQKQWCNRFDRWIEFFRHDCPKVRHLLLCLNKADLFCGDLDREAEQLAYVPNQSRMNWQQRDQYVFQRYFRPIQAQIQDLNRSIQGLSVRCFITSTRHRDLLELPWIYLGSFLEKKR